MTLNEASKIYVGTDQNRYAVVRNNVFTKYWVFVSQTIPTIISGAIDFIKDGAGELTLSGACDYTGTTKINAGQLAISSASTLNGVISGSGSLKKTGSTNLNIGGNNTYSGGTFCQPSTAGGTITISSATALGTGLFTSSGSFGQIISGLSGATNPSFTLTNDFEVTSGTLQFRVNTGTNTLTIAGNISGAGGINKTSTGRLYLNGTLTYTGSTSTAAGTLRAIKTTGASTATASFTNTTLSVAFNVSPPSGTTTDFRFFQGTTLQSYASVTLSGVPVGTTATYTSSTSTLAVTVP